MQAAPRCRSLVAPLLGVALLLSLTYAGVPEPEFCSTGEAGASEQVMAVPDSNRRMAENLYQLINDGYSFESPYRFPETVEKLGEVMAQADPETVFQFRLAYADALLRAGEPIAALEQFETHEAALAMAADGTPSTLHVAIQNANALCHPRLGEQEKCLHHHSVDSCILPIQEGGVHVLRQGSEGAVATLQPHLQRYPGDLRARWLLNI